MLGQQANKKKQTNILSSLYVSIHTVESTVRFSPVFNAEGHHYINRTIMNSSLSVEMVTEDNTLPMSPISENNSLSLFPMTGNESILSTVQNFSLPPDMVFGEAHVIAIVAYSILFCIGVTTNAASLRYVCICRHFKDLYGI